MTSRGGLREASPWDKPPFAEHPRGTAVSAPRGAEARRKPVAQPGNLNALKHGYNARKTISGRPSARWVARSPDASQETMTTPKNGFHTLIQSIREKSGHSFVIVFARQSGRNELQAHMFVYLLAVLSRYALNIVSVSPTFKPQALIGMGRLEKVLSRNLFTRRVWKRKDGFKYCLGSSQVIFLSSNPSASVVGETAHILLSVDKVHSVDPGRFDIFFFPQWPLPITPPVSSGAPPGLRAPSSPANAASPSCSLPHKLPLHFCLPKWGGLAKSRITYGRRGPLLCSSAS